MTQLHKIDLGQWDARHARLARNGLCENAYGGALGRHVGDGDTRLLKLQFDDSPASLRLWNFLLTEEERLAEARRRGVRLVGAMKDLGTVPVMAFSLPGLRAFYPDGAWWIPCIMEMSDGLFAIADSMGFDESFCPARAMLGAFATQNHFPLPDLLISSNGATCDDFSCFAQQLQRMGHRVVWWEMPHRRQPEANEESVELPGETRAPVSLVRYVKTELSRVGEVLSRLAQETLTEEKLAQGIHAANAVRQTLRELRHLVFTAPVSPLPALELLIAEMLAIHFCSDREESLAVLNELLEEVKRRTLEQAGFGSAEDVRVYWVNPVADLRAMNLLESCGARLCGTDFMFCHALDAILENLPPFEALARMALADPMVGALSDRARRIFREAKALHAEAVVVSRIPGASHCAFEGAIIHKILADELSIPVVEVEVPPLCDSMLPTIQTRLEALVEIARQKQRRSGC